jgi:hypothetical protein
MTAQQHPANQQHAGQVIQQYRELMSEAKQLCKDLELETDRNEHNSWKTPWTFGSQPQSVPFGG